MSHCTSQAHTHTKTAVRAGPMIRTMNFLQAAIMYGHESARLLASTTPTERPWQALSLMKRAARALKHPMHHEVDTVRNAETRTRHDVSERCENVNPLRTTIYYVYRRPLEIPVHATRCSEKEQDELVLTMRLYTIFNLALAYHQLGELSGNGTWLGKAMEYYGTLIHSLSSERDARNGGNMDHLLCLALNNAACLHFDRFEYAVCACCLHFMTDVVDTTDCLCRSRLVTTVEAEEMMLNRVYLEPPKAASSA
jgi:hypothetical protein